MASVKFPVAVGGDDSTVTDDANPLTGLDGGGHRKRFVPALTQIVNIANWIVGKTPAIDAAATHANNAKASADAADISEANAAASAASVDPLNLVHRDASNETIAGTKNFTGVLQLGGASITTIATRFKATVAQFFLGTADTVLTSDIVASAYAPVVLGFAAPVAWDWRDGYYRGPVTFTANGTIGLPANVRPGESRMMDLAGNDATARTVSFAAGFKGPIPSIADLTSTKLYRLIFTADTAGAVTVFSEVRS